MWWHRPAPRRQRCTHNAGDCTISSERPSAPVVASRCDSIVLATRLRGVLPLILLLGAASASAQTGTGRIAGEVLDSRTGAAVSGADIELTGTDKRVQRARAAADGRFVFTQLPPGEYRIRVLLGTQSAARAGADRIERTVTIGTGTTTVRIDVADATVALDSLVVVASSIGLRRGETEFGVRLAAASLELLPVPYDPAGAAGLAAGVTGDRIWGGAAREANLYQLDGLSLTHPGTGGYLVPLSPSWVEAVEVRGLGAGAALGNFQGGVVNIMTRSGTNTARSTVRTSFEDLGLNASHDIVNEISRERVQRFDVEADWSGPLQRDRLFLFAGGHVLRDRYRVQTHLPGIHAAYLPHEEQRTEARALAKLTWLPRAGERIDASAVIGRGAGSNWALTGYEAAGAAPDYTAPSRMLMLSWQRPLAGAARLDVRASHAATHERWAASAGPDVPAVRVFTHGDPPTPVYQNAPFDVERRPELNTVQAVVALGGGLLGARHEVTAGAELSTGSWLDRRTRTGGMTWRPARRPSLDPADPSTWFFSQFIPTDWGGEVELHARTRSGALFAEDRIRLHERFSLNAGLRLATWQGDLLPRGDAKRRIRAIDATAWEPRVGAIFDPFGTELLLLKAHWGRYHQNLLASMFDRTEGGDVFSDRELWYYYGPAPATSTTTFTQAQRDAASTATPHFLLQELIRLNETGPVAADYRQPHMDQWLAGVEAAPARGLRVEAVYIHRRHDDLVALMDLNLADNYHAFRNVFVRTSENQPVLLNGEPLVVPAVYIPNDAIVRTLRYIANGAELPRPPGFTLADTARLTFEQNFLLGNEPDARRELRQLQVTARLARPSWGAWISLALSRLTGNLDAASGYAAGTGYERFWELGAGPFVRPNEQINYHGNLPGSHPVEIKAAVHGELPWSLRGGAVLEARRGEYFTPFLTLSGLTHRFFTEEGEIDVGMLSDVAGQRIFIQPRGQAHYADRVTLDVRLERDVPLPSGTWRVSADVFNLRNAATPMRINSSVTYASTDDAASRFTVIDAPALYGAVWERVPPRTLRIGLSRASSR